MFSMNKFKGLLVLFLLIFSTFSFTLKEVKAEPILPTFAGGAGTEVDPYQISTCQQLEDINYTPDEGGTYPFLTTGKYFILKNDIDCSDTENWDDGAGFDPIGSIADMSDWSEIRQPFYGFFDGDNHTISNLYINRPSYSNIGLFGNIYNADSNISIIKDLNVVNVDISGDNAGVLIGMSEYSSIINCHTSGIIKSSNTESSLGGLIGFAKNSTINKSSSSVSVEGDIGFVGGLVGVGHNITIENSYATGNVFGSFISGGLLGMKMVNGYNDKVHSFIKNSYATGDVTGALVGGLVGFNQFNEITNSYSTGKITPVSSPYLAMYGFSEDSVAGGFIGGLLYDQGESTDDYVSNSGWYNSVDNNSLSAIGAYGYYGQGYVPEGVNAEISYPISDNILFYSKSHGVYAQGEEGGWDFTTPIWYEQLNDYPKFTAYIPDTSSPVVSNITANSITKTSATLNGEVTDNGGEEITEVGFEYGLTSAYATSTVESTDYASSTFSYDLTDLSCNTTYSYRAYATNTKGTSYSSSGTFTTDDCERSHSRVIGSVSRVIATLPVKEEVKPISTVTILNIKRILKQNIIGSDIKELQVWLNNHGYIISLIGPGSKGYETTKFGSLTKKAVMSFQKANGLTPDGVVGPKTLEKMK